MSWFGYHKSINVSDQEKQRQLERAQRHKRLQERELQRKQLQAAVESRREASQALKDFLDIDPNLFSEEELSKVPSIEVDIETLNESIKMVNFDSKDEENGADAMKNMGHIKLKWLPTNPDFFFSQFETELQIFGINKQYTKRQALIRCLPEDVALEFKHLVVLQEDAAGTTPYKTLKTALLKAYGPKPVEAFQRALNRVMVGKPSVLLKLLISDICKSNLAKNCCCATTIWGLFQLKIPLYLKTHLANEEFSAATMENIMDRADNLWLSNQGDKEVAEVKTPLPTENENAAEIAAMTRGRGRGARGFRGNGRGGRGRGGKPENFNPANDPRGKRHESNPPWNSCTAHWLYSDKAWKCQAPLTCPLKNKVTPKA